VEKKQWSSNLLFLITAIGTEAGVRVRVRHRARDACGPCTDRRDAVWTLLRPQRCRQHAASSRARPFEPRVEVPLGRKSERPTGLVREVAG